MVFDDVETEHQRIFTVCDRSILIFDLRGIQINCFESIHTYSTPRTTRVPHLLVPHLLVPPHGSRLSKWRQQS